MMAGVARQDMNSIFVGDQLEGGVCKALRRPVKFRPKFHGPAQSLAHAAFELIANEKAVHILPGYASHHSPPGVVILPLADPEVTWKILVTWRRGKAGGALKALLDTLFRKVTPKAS